MFVLVSYDIVEDSIRADVARVLLAYGRRVQKSVFECVVSDGQYLELRRCVDRLVRPYEDSVRYYVLCRRCVPLVQVTGLGTVTEDDSDQVYIV